MGAWRWGLEIGAWSAKKKNGSSAISKNKRTKSRPPRLKWSGVKNSMSSRRPVAMAGPTMTLPPKTSAKVGSNASTERYAETAQGGRSLFFSDHVRIYSLKSFLGSYNRTEKRDARLLMSGKGSLCVSIALLVVWDKGLIRVGEGSEVQVP